MKPVNFSEVIFLALKQAKIKAANRPVVLKVEIQADPCMVQMDSEKILWVVMELAENAIKFTPPGGCVTVGLEKGVDLVKFQVADTGIGISAEKLDEIFEPYHQLDGSSTRRYGGIGLGLALVKKIVEAHGSQINVTSEAGKGTVIAFHLPALKSDHV
jgi:signal transduction histidine kinase